MRRLALFDALTQAGVKLYVCAQAANVFQVKKGQIAEPVDLALSAMTTLVMLERRTAISGCVKEHFHRLLNTAACSRASGFGLGAWGFGRSRGVPELSSTPKLSVNRATPFSAQVAAETASRLGGRANAREINATTARPPAMKKANW